MSPRTRANLTAISIASAIIAASGVAIIADSVVPVVLLGLALTVAMILAAIVELGPPSDID